MTFLLHYVVDRLNLETISFPIAPLMLNRCCDFSIFGFKQTKKATFV